MNKYKKLAFNTMIFAVGSFGSKILVILLTNLYTKFISPDDLSTKDLLETMALFLWPIFSLSMNEAVIRFGLDKKYDKRQIFTTSTTLTVLGLLAMALIVPILRFIPFLEFISGYTLLLIIYVFTSSIRNQCASFVRARDMVKLFSLDGILATLMLLVFNLIFIAKFNMGVKGFMISVILSDACSSLFLFTTARLGKFLNIRWFSPSLGKSMLKFSLPLIPTVVMWTITSLSDRMFIRYMHSSYAFVGAAAAGLYGVANKIPNLISMVSTIFFQAWNMSAITENDSADRSDFYHKVFSAYEAVLFIASAGLILLVKPVSAVIANSSTYSEYGTIYLYTPVLILACVFTCLDQFLGSIYTATKHTNNSFWTSAIACGVNLLLNTFLIPVWGIQGASIATFLSYFICFWVRIVDARYYVPFKFSGLRSIANTSMILAMCGIVIFGAGKNGFLNAVLLTALTGVVIVMNYKALMATVMKLLRRG